MTIQLLDDAILLDSGAIANHEDCCCEEDCFVESDCLAVGDEAATIDAVLPEGWVSDICDNCEAIDGTYTLDRTGPYTYHYEDLTFCNDITPPLFRDIRLEIDVTLDCLSSVCYMLLEITVGLPVAAPSTWLYKKALASPFDFNTDTAILDYDSQGVPIGFCTEDDRPATVTVQPTPP